MTQLKIGDQAPDFKLYNTEKQAIELSSLRGQNVVILFFPLAFTSTCTAELCGVRDDISSYGNLNTTVLGISVDTVFSLNKFKAEQNINFDLLSDFNKTVCQAYGSYYDNFVLDMLGVAKRSAFVIDKEGIIRYAEVLESAGDVPDLEAVKKTLSTL
ncbi:MAG TPA: redoxin domain-containing protein [Bacteroidia bacterium]